MEKHKKCQFMSTNAQPVDKFRKHSRKFQPPPLTPVPIAKGI